MKKRIVSILVTAAVLAGSVCGISAADAEMKNEVLSPRASIELVDGIIKGVTGPMSADSLKTQFTGDVTVTSVTGDVIADDKNVPSDSTVAVGGENVATFILKGDASRDGKINLGDASAMLKSIAKWSIDISNGAADIDGGGKVNLGDVSTLLKYLAKWDVKLFDDAAVLSVFTEGVTEYKLLANDSATDTAIAEGIKKLTGNDIEIVTEASDGDKFITVGMDLSLKYDFIDGVGENRIEDTRAYIDTYGGNIYLSANTDAGILGCINYITNQAFTPELDMNIPKGTVGELGDLETLIHPLFTTVEVKGITESHRLLHATDSHITTVYDDEETPERRANVMSRLNDWMLNMYRKPSYLYFNEYFNYAENISAEAIMLTGDITDSPSQSNRDILEAAIDNCTVPTYYIYGNHDWTWNNNAATGDVYQSENFRVSYRNGFAAAVDKYDEDWSDYYNVNDMGEYVIVSIDNGTYGFPVSRPAYNGVKAAFDNAKAAGKPIILMLHIPLHTDEMHQNVPHIKDGGSGYCITPGEGQYGALYYDMITAEDSPVAAIFCGHVHDNYMTMVEGRIPQYLTGAALQGWCRVIDLVPAE